MNNSWRNFIRVNGGMFVACWTVLVLVLAGFAVYDNHRTTIAKAEKEARDYFRLNVFYRAWGSRMGGVYVPADKVAPNQYLTVPHRDIRSQDGQNLTLVNPAYMTRMVFEEIQAASPDPIISRLVSVKPLNPLNSPDRWEQESLEAFERKDGSERSEITTVNGKPYLRFISAFVTDKPCLKCHAQQGYKAGDVRGGITISIPMSGPFKEDKAAAKRTVGRYMFLWLMGTTGIVAMSRRRHRDEIDLRNNELKFRTVCDWTQDWEYWVDPAGQIKYVSPSCLVITGYSVNEFMADTGLLTQIVHPDDRKTVNNHHCITLEQGDASDQQIQFRIVTRNGETRWIHHLCRQVNINGENMGRRVSNRDITAIVLANSQLQENATRHQAIVNTSLDGFWVVDTDGQLVDINDRCCVMYGYSRDEMIGMKIPDIDASEHSEETVSRINTIINSGYARFEAQHRCKDGRIIDVEINTSYLPDARQFMVFVRDISERKQADIELRLREDRLRRSQQITHTGTWELNVETGSLYWSDEIYRIFEIEQTESGVDYPAFLATIHPGDRDMVNDAYQKSLENKSIYSIDHRLLFSDNRVKWVHEECETTFDENGKPLISLGTVQDITLRKRVEKERLDLEQQMQQVQKLESLGVLAGGIAHDFNNILMAIIGNADLALMRINKESPIVENLHRIEQAAARASDLAKQMLAYSGKGRFVVENLNLNILLDEMLHMLEVSISKKAVLRLNPHQSLPLIEADATQMRQVIMNLVINASEAIGEKSGVIAITTGCMDCDQSYLKNVWLDENLSTGLYVYMEIADTGCGMDKETLAKLFDPFFTTKFTGRGLGMSAVLGIVRGHKGAIKVYSELNKGTSFKILLPASSRPAELFNGQSCQDDWKGSGTVLLVDDEETVRGIGKEMLHELGFNAITANDGREAVEIFKNTPSIDFVILDLTMPHMDGEQCFRELKQMRSSVKVIMSSGYNQQEVTQKFVGKGLAGFIQKPYKLSVLKEAIQALFP